MFNLAIQIPADEAIDIVRRHLEKYNEENPEKSKLSITNVSEWMDRYGLPVKTIYIESGRSAHGCYLNFHLVHQHIGPNIFSISSECCACEDLYILHKKISEDFQRDHFGRNRWPTYPTPYEPKFS